MKIKKIIPIMVIASAPLLGFAQEQLKSGISLENLDRTANPGESFYQFACGGWMKNNPLPAAYSRYGKGRDKEGICQRYGHRVHPPERHDGGRGSQPVEGLR